MLPHAKTNLSAYSRRGRGLAMQYIKTILINDSRLQHNNGTRYQSGSFLNPSGGRLFTVCVISSFKADRGNTASMIKGEAYSWLLNGGGRECDFNKGTRKRGNGEVQGMQQCNVICSMLAQRAECQFETPNKLTMTRMIPTPDTRAQHFVM
jgi:hypothetical protein